MPPHHGLHATASVHATASTPQPPSAQRPPRHATHQPTDMTILKTSASPPTLAQPKYTPAGSPSNAAPKSSTPRLAVGIPSSLEPRPKPRTTVPDSGTKGASACIAGYASEEGVACAAAGWAAMMDRCGRSEVFLTSHHRPWPEPTPVSYSTSSNRNQCSLFSHPSSRRGHLRHPSP